MQKLVAGIDRFQKGVFDQKRELFEGLAAGQQPLALFITCSDSRIDPNLLTQTEPGELFILRNAGNIVPPYGAVNGGESATIEYAVSVLGVKNIVICGHSHCGAMAGLLDQASTKELPEVRSWLKYADAARRIVATGDDNVADTNAQLPATIEANVLVQLDHLKTHPAVRAAMARDEIALHGWVYRFESGHVDCLDPTTNQFLPLQSNPLYASIGAGN